jgi:hypothetical protein
MCVPFFYYLADVCTGFPSAPSNWISPLCGTAEAAWMHTPTSHYSHLAIRTQTESLLHLSHVVQSTDQAAVYLVGNKTIFPVSDLPS